MGPRETKKTKGWMEAETPLSSSSDQQTEPKQNKGNALPPPFLSRSLTSISVVQMAVGELMEMSGNDER